MRACPEFYGWDAARQKHYRIHQPEAEQFVLERSVFREVYGVNCETESALRAAWDEVPIGELDAINEILLPWLGIGEDCFYFNEYMLAENRLHFDTLDDYAHADHAFQESARQEDDAAHVIKPYKGNLYACWARLFVDGQFRYATLSNLAGHLHMHISELGHDAIDALIPHEYVSGPDDGKPDGKCFVWDKRPDAGGLEPQLDELNRRVYQYEHARWLELLDEFDQQAATTVYLRDVSNGVDEQLHFIFSDKTAMAHVRLRHFVRDCRHIERDGASLCNYEQREADLIKAFVHAQYKDIMQNFNPKVAKLTKRRRILMHKNAFR